MGHGVGKMLEGVNVELRAQANSAVSSKQGRDELWDAGHKISSSLKQASQNSFGSTHTSGDTAQLGKAVDDAEQATAAVQNAVANSESFKKSASQIAQAGGNTQVNPVNLEQAYESRAKAYAEAHPDKPGPSAGMALTTALTSLYGGNVAQMQADLSKMNGLESNPNVAKSRLLIRGINGNTAGLSADNRYAAMSGAFETFDGSTVDTGQKVQARTNDTAKDYADTAGKVHTETGAVQAQAKPAAASATAAATAAQNRVNGGDPVTPPTGVSSNLSGSQAGDYGGAGVQSALYQLGARQVATHTGEVPDAGRAAAMLHQAELNTGKDNVMLNMTRWANGHLGLTAAGIGVFNFLGGAVDAGSALAAGAAVKKILGKLGGGEPPTPGAPGAPSSPGGAAGEFPRAPGGPLPEGDPTPKIPGAPGSPSLGSPAGTGAGEGFAEILDSTGRVVGKTAITEAESKMPAQALGEMLAARAAMAGGVAMRMGGQLVDFATAGPAVVGSELLLHTSSLGAGTLPQSQAESDARKALMLNDPGFRQQAMDYTRMVGEGKGSTPQAQQMYEQIQGRIQQGVQDPSSIPAQPNVLKVRPVDTKPLFPVGE